MKSSRRIEVLLNEEVWNSAGTLEDRLVPHIFSPEFAIQVVLTMLRALAAIQSHQEIQDLEALLVTAMRELGHDRGTVPESHERLRIHEV